MTGGEMKLPAMPWSDSGAVGRLLRSLGVGEGMTRLVGGAVRDGLLGLPVSDIDFATRLPPGEVVERLEAAGIKAVPTGIAHGTVTAVSDGRPFEVTTLRRDVQTDGRHAVVAFTDNWREDASRRDFTINALYADPLTGELFDYHGGLDDIGHGRVRFIGDPLQRIAEDHLRILRFFRFHARFGRGTPDPAALDACTRRANDLMALSRERVAGELLKLLALDDPSPTVAVMVNKGILAPVLPEITSEGVEGLRRLAGRERESGIAGRAIRRLAALLPRDPETATAVAYRLRLSNEDRRTLALASEGSNSRSGSAWQRAHGIGAEAAIDRLLLGDEPIELVREQAGVLTQGTLPDFPLKGRDLIAMGLPPGPLVSRTLLAATDRYVGEDFPGDARAREITREAVDQALRDNR